MKLKNKNKSEVLFNEANAELDNKNFSKAADLLDAAIREGCVAAINTLAVCYYDGTGRKKDRAAAILLWHRAARLGDICAMGGLGVVYRDEGKFNLAEKWFLRGVAAGDPGYAIQLAKLQLRRKTRAAAVLASLNLTVATQGAENSLLSEAEEEEIEELQRKVKKLRLPAVSSG